MLPRMKDDLYTHNQKCFEFQKAVNKYMQEYNDIFLKYDKINVKDRNEDIKFDVNLKFELKKDIHQITTCIKDCIQLKSFETEDCQKHNNIMTAEQKEDESSSDEMCYCEMCLKEIADTDVMIIDGCNHIICAKDVTKCVIHDLKLCKHIFFF